MRAGRPHAIPQPSLPVPLRCPHRLLITRPLERDKATLHSQGHGVPPIP